MILKHPVTGCTCAEGRLTAANGRHTGWMMAHRATDCGYIAARNAIVAAAVEAVTLRLYASEERGLTWDEAFTAEVARRVAEARKKGEL